MKILFIISLIFISINIMRFVLANYAIFKSNKYPLKLKIWNLFETLLMLYGIIVIWININNL